MNILALDLATKTGWATHINSIRHSGIQDFSLARGESVGMRFLKLRGWLNRMRELMARIDVIYYEQAHHRGGGATAAGVGFVTEVLAFAAGHNIETAPVHTGTLKKFATGKGNASKDEMIQAAINRGYRPKDDNEADAALLLDYAMCDLGIDPV